MKKQAPDTTYPISLSEAAELTGVAPSTISTIARRLGLGRVCGRIRLLRRAELAEILSKKRPGPGQPPKQAT